MDNPAFDLNDVQSPKVFIPAEEYHRRKSSSTPKVPDEDKKDDVVQLKKELGLFSGIALIVGSMIGSGIFVSPADLLNRTNSVGLSLVIWAACGILSTLGAVAYIELGTVVNTSGAEYAYLLAALGPIPAFLFAWLCTLILKPALVSVICLAFAEYVVNALVDTQEKPVLAIKLVASATILVIAFINCISVKLAAQVQNVTTVAKLLAIVVIVACGFYKLGTGNTEYLSRGFEGSTNSPGIIATAFYSGLWAYDGWNNLNFVTEEIKNPYRNLPLAIIIGLPLVTVCYILVNVSYLTVLSPEEMIASSAVAYDFGNRVLGPMAFLMPLSVAFSTFGAANGALFATGRVAYAASKEGHLLEVLSYIDIKRFTPSPSIIFNTVVALVMVIPGDIGSLIDLFNFTAWIVYGAAMAALIILRFKMKDAPRPFKVPIVIPVLVFLISIYLVFAPIIDNPTIEYLYASAFILAGLIFYIPFVHFKIRVPGIDKFTTIIQLTLNVAPPKGTENIS